MPHDPRRRDHRDRRARARGAETRAAPGRCPCRGSRARSPSRLPSARSRPACLRDQRPARARSPADSDPRRARRLQRRQDVVARRTPRARRARARATAPSASARSRTSVELAPLPDVERHRDHLGAVLLRQPGDGDRRVEPAGIRERRFVPLLSRFPIDRLHPTCIVSRSPSTARERGRARATADHQDGVVAGDRPDDVRQPADRSLRRAAAPAPGRSCRTTSCSTARTLRRYSAIARPHERRPGRPRRGRTGAGQPISAVGRGLDEPEVADVPRQRRLGDLEAPLPEQLAQLLLAGNVLAAAMSSRITACLCAFIRLCQSSD